MRRLGLVAVVVVIAAAAGGVAGWQFPWVASALGAAVLVMLAGLGYWLRQRFNDLHRRQLAQQKALDKLLQLERRAGTQLRTIARLDKAQAADIKRTHRSLKGAIASETRVLAKTASLEGERSRRHADRLFRQLEALQNLHQLFDVRRPMAPTRGWALSPDLLITYVEEILARDPRCVVECGSGVSTVWAAYALELCGSGGRVVALDHDAEFAEKTRVMLAEHELTAFAEVRHAPLTAVELADGSWQWYDPAALKDLDQVGVLLVDGPPKPTGLQARYPAIPLLRDVLVPGAAVLADDALREDEQAILERWVTEWPELTLERLPHEKGSARLLVPGSP